MATPATPTTPPTLPRLPSLDPTQRDPDRTLLAIVMVFDDGQPNQADRREAGATLAFGPGGACYGLYPDPLTPIALNPTLPLADALWTLLAARHAEKES